MDFNRERKRKGKIYSILLQILLSLIFNVYEYIDGKEKEWRNFSKKRYNIFVHV